MSDELDSDDEIPERVKRLHAYRLEDFLTHLGRKGFDRPCDACGAHKWATPCDEDGRPTMLSMEITNPGEGVQLYITRICKTCANTKFYNVGWLLSDYVGSGDDDE